MTSLKLERGLVFYDIEATGLDTNRDRIVEIALLKLNPDGSKQTLTYLVHPEMPIPPESTAIHHISDEMVKDSPKFNEIAGPLLEFIGDSDLAGYNILSFDVPMLVTEFSRAQIAFDLTGRALVDAMKIFHFKEPRDLSAAYKFYCGKEMSGAHRALNDIEATIDILEGQLNKYGDLPKTAQDLSAFCNPVDDRFVDKTRRFIWRNGEAVINFGKHRGRSLREMKTSQPDYLSWIMGSDFSTEVKGIAKDALQGIFPEKK